MSPIAITLTLLVLVIILFVTEKLPLAVTSMIALMVLVLTGVLSPKDAFAGFVDSNLILWPCSSSAVPFLKRAWPTR